MLDTRQKLENYSVNIGQILENLQIIYKKNLCHKVPVKNAE